MRTFIAEALEREGHDVSLAADGAEALKAAREEPFDVVITDLHMPRVDGMTLVRTLRTEQPDVELIVLTAFGDVPTAVEAMKLGVLDYLQKPLSGPAAVRELVRRALSRRVALAVPADTPAPRSRLTFGAPSMIPVVEALAKVAKAGATVRLQGESGTGKEVRTGSALARRRTRRAPAGRTVIPRCGIALTTSCLSASPAEPLEARP